FPHLTELRTHLVEPLMDRFGGLDSKKDVERKLGLQIVVNRPQTHRLPDLGQTAAVTPLSIQFESLRDEERRQAFPHEIADIFLFHGDLCTSPCSCIPLRSSVFYVSRTRRRV